MLSCHQQLSAIEITSTHQDRFDSLGLFHSSYVAVIRFCLHSLPEAIISNCRRIPNHYSFMCYWPLLYALTAHSADVQSCTMIRRWYGFSAIAKHSNAYRDVRGAKDPSFNLTSMLAFRGSYNDVYLLYVVRTLDGLVGGHRHRSNLLPWFLHLLAPVFLARCRLHFCEEC